MLYDVNGNIVCDSENIGGASYTDAQCTQAFLSYMAKKCTQFGMSGTTYASPSGQTQSSSITAQDMLKLGIAVAASTKGSDIWASKNQSFSIKGDNARTLAVTNNVISGTGATLDAAGYNFLGGKGGSLIYGSAYHRAGLDMVDIDGHPVIVSLLAYGQTNYNNIATSTKELCDMVSASLAGQTPSEGTNLAALVAGDGGYAACLVPTNVAAYVNLETPAMLLTREHSQSASPTKTRYPASTSKAMTMLCALDYFTNLHETVTVKTVDIESGSGSTFYNGDKLAIGDALRIMMMESSNTLANMVARETGRRILSNA